jgi:hypothetical protein
VKHREAAVGRTGAGKYLATAEDAVELQAVNPPKGARLRRVTGEGSCHYDRGRRGFFKQCGRDLTTGCVSILHNLKLLEQISCSDRADG